MKVTARKICEFIFYVGLLVFALVFCWQTVQEYTKATTSYSVTQQHITLQDIPTITVCWNVDKYRDLGGTYGKDFSIDVRVVNKENKKAVPLMENENVQTLFNLEIHLKEIRQAKKPDMPCYTQGWSERQCYQIASKWKGEAEMIDFKKFGVQIAIKFSNNSYAIGLRAEVLVSSEENSYGLAGGRWYDGHIDCINGVNTGDSIKIIKVTEYLNMPSTCSHSYYGCLAERLIKQGMGQVSNKNINGLECRSMTVCTPFSLPYKRRQIPVCQNETERACFEDIVEDLRLDQEKYCKKACHVEEYLTKLVLGGIKKKYDIGELTKHWEDWLTKNWNFQGRDPLNSLVFEYEFELPSITRDQRSEDPFKTVNTEYLIITWQSLVGTVGGTLGIFVGFSFIKIISPHSQDTFSNLLGWLKGA